MKVIYRSTTPSIDVPEWLTPFRSLCDHLDLSTFVIVRHEGGEVTLEVDDAVDPHLFGCRVSLLKDSMETGLIKQAGFAHHFQLVA